MFPPSKKSNHPDLSESVERQCFSNSNKVSHPKVDLCPSRKFSTDKCIDILSQFYPRDWLAEITSLLKACPKFDLIHDNNSDWFSLYLAFIELFLNFRGLSISTSTLQDIAMCSHVSISEYRISFWRLKILQSFPDFQRRLLLNFHDIFDALFIKILFKVLNEEFCCQNFSSKEVFLFRHYCLSLAKSFLALGLSSCLDDPVFWARTLCSKALMNLFPNISFSDNDLYNYSNHSPLKSF
ncbi:MAG: hypothetical protein ACTSW1_16100 [Candidatus Hodarchaeales archaeon]